MHENNRAVCLQVTLGEGTQKIKPPCYDLSFTLNFIYLPIFPPVFNNKIIKSWTVKRGILPTVFYPDID